MFDLIKGKVLGKKVLIVSLLLMMIYCFGIPISVHAATEISASLSTDRTKGICTYAVKGIDLALDHNMIMEVNEIKEDNTEENVLNSEIKLSTENCFNGVYAGAFLLSNLSEPKLAKYSVNFYLGDNKEKVVASNYADFSIHKEDFKFSIEDKEQGIKNVIFTPASNLEECVIPGENNKLVLSMWKENEEESKAVQIGGQQQLGNKEIVWTINQKELGLDYGTVNLKLSVLSSLLKKTPVTVATTTINFGVKCESFVVKKTSELETQKSFGVYMNGIECQNGVKTVTFAVFNSKGKQVYTCNATDINGDGSVYYKAISMENLNNVLDNYSIKAYVTDKKGKSYEVKETCKVNQKLKKGSLSVTNSKDKTVSFKVKNAYVPGGFKKVEFVVYTKTGGKSKSVVYKGSASKDKKQYTASMKVSSFKYKKTGAYNVSAYGYTNWGQKLLLNNEQFNISTVKTTASGKVKETAKGTFAIRVAKMTVPAGITDVSVKVWGQSQSVDGYSYKAKKLSDGSYEVVVDVANHKFYFGTYQAKVYVTMGNGIKVISATCKYNFAPKNFISFGEQNDEYLREFCVYNLSETGSVSFEVYSKKNGTDDLVTYWAKKNGSGYKADIKMSSINDAGTIYIKIKVNGKLIKTYTFQLSQKELVKSGWVYEMYNGKRYKFYYENGEKLTDLTQKLGLKQSNETNINKFYIEINRAACCVTVYAYNSGTGHYDIPVKTCAVSVGRDTWTAAGTSGLNENTSYTPLGEFSICTNGYGVKYSVKPMVEPDGSTVYARWASHIVGNVYFHSIAVGSDSHYALNPNNYNKLGSPASAGCIRMTVRDAKWIYDYASKGSIVNIVKGNASYPGPLGKPKTIKVSSSIHYDPTDPEVPDSKKEADFKAGRITGYTKRNGVQVWK